MNRRVNRQVVAVLFVALTSVTAAFPEFQKYSQDHSARRVDCAMCHISSTGPSGSGYGQISGLTDAEKELLTESRSAKQPGKDVKSPILNAFGNNLVKQLGIDKITELTTEPVKLATTYGFSSDLDADGIPDAQEYLEGTDPTSNQSGRPWALFTHNVHRNWIYLASCAAATLFLLVGLGNLLRAYLVGVNADEENSIR